MDAVEIKKYGVTLPSIDDTEPEEWDRKMAAISVELGRKMTEEGVMVLRSMIALSVGCALMTDLAAGYLADPSTNSTEAEREEFGAKTHIAIGEIETMVLGIFSEASLAVISKQKIDKKV